MTTADQIPAAEAVQLLGYKNRSSLTRLVQAGDITPAFTASGARGEQFFDRADVIALRVKLNAASSSPLSAAPSADDGALLSSAP